MAWRGIEIARIFTVFSIKAKISNFNQTGEEWKKKSFQKKSYVFRFSSTLLAVSSWIVWGCNAKERKYISFFYFFRNSFVLKGKLFARIIFYLEFGLLLQIPSKVCAVPDSQENAQHNAAALIRRSSFEHKLLLALSKDLFGLSLLNALIPQSSCCILK